MGSFVAWTGVNARAWIAVPSRGDDKYSRGVLGMVTGSPRFPGAAVLSVDAALHAGVGMVRYLGPSETADRVLARRPEVVTVPGRVQAWVIGSGMEETTTAVVEALEDGAPAVLDAGAIDASAYASGPVIVTPHAGELARVLGVEREAIVADPEGAVDRAVERLGVTVMLKGYVTRVGAPDGTRLVVQAGTTWLATAGTGDALAGILGSLLATHARDAVRDPGALARLAATASVVHSRAAVLASDGGPFTVTRLIECVPRAIAELLTA